MANRGAISPIRRAALCAAVSALAIAGAPVAVGQEPPPPETLDDPPPVPVARLTIDKNSRTSEARRGDLARWNIITRNPGETAATNVVTCDILPRNARLVWATGRPKVRDGRVCFRTAERLDGGDIKRYRITVRVKRATRSSRVVNRATAKGDNTDLVRTRSQLRLREGCSR